MHAETPGEYSRHSPAVWGGVGRQLRLWHDQFYFTFSEVGGRICGYLVITHVWPCSGTQVEVMARPDEEVSTNELHRGVYGLWVEIRTG